MCWGMQLLNLVTEFKSILNSTGVVFSSLGTFLVWRYLTAINFADTDVYLKGQGILTVPDPCSSDVYRMKRSILLSKFGLGLILVGGAFQVVSNHISGA